MEEDEINKKLVRNIWHHRLKIDWPLGLALILAVGIFRFYLVLQANVTGQYQSVAYIFLLMVILPVALLNKQGMKSIGLVKPTNWRWIAYSMILGSLFCWLVYIIGISLYDHQINNWFVYISQSYLVDKTVMSASDFRIYFLIYTLVSMSFSPIGEELFYRGLIHRCFAGRFGARNASYIDNAAFAMTHLAHFGFIYHLGQWQFHWGPAFLWIALIFSAGSIFAVSKERSGSLLGAILSHAAFNVIMIYCIFYKIL